MSGHNTRARLDVAAVAKDKDRRRCYLLFAGSRQTPQGGLGDLVAAFSSEEAARQAFQHIRLNQTSPGSWAQLAVVGEDHGIRAMCWFGTGATPARQPVISAGPDNFVDRRTKGRVMHRAIRDSQSPAGLDVEPTARRHPVKRMAVGLVGLVAVGITTIGVMSDCGTTRPVTTTRATVDVNGLSGGPVVPFYVEPSAVPEGAGGVDG